MKVLVTGASGFIGSHLCSALARRGDSVRAMYRRREPPAELSATASEYAGRVELFNGDLKDESRVREAVAGVDAVIHSAALASDWGPLSLFIEQNYDATVSLLDTARDSGLRVFVYISSAQVHGYGDHVDTTERGPYYPLKYPYQISKRMAEEYVLAQNSETFRTVALRPCNVYGPGDYMSTYTMFDAVMEGFFGYLGPGETLTCPIFIDDLCAGVLAALDCQDAAGQAVILTDGAKVRWKDYAAAFYKALGSSKKPISLPRPIAYTSAFIMSGAAHAFGSRKAPPLTPYVVEQGSRNFHFSNQKARSLLGFEPKTFIDEGIPITAEAYLKAREVAIRSGIRRPRIGRH